MKKIQWNISKIAIFTILLSFLWTTLSRILNLLSPVTYNEIFKNSSTIFWHTTFPMVVTFIVFVLVIGDDKKVRSIYVEEQPPLNNFLFKGLGYLVIGSMLLFSLFNLYHNLITIGGNLNTSVIFKLLSTLVATAMIGFTEESIFRVFVLKEMRKEHNELKSYIISTLLFGSWHFPNIIVGAPLDQTLVQIVTTMIIGSGYYLALRVTNKLWIPIGLHWLWDFVLAIPVI